VVGIDFGRVFKPGRDPYAGLVIAEDEQGLAHRSRRDWIVDTALFVVAVFFGALALANQIDRGLDGPLLVADVVGGGALMLALWGRRRWPFGFGLASVPVAAFSSFAFVPGVIALFTVAAYRRWQLAFVVFALQLAVLPIYRTVQIGDSVPEAAHYIICALAYAAIVASGMYVRTRRQSVRERTRHAVAEQHLIVEQARYGERTRIAREMHDVLAHRISLLSLHAGALEFRPDAPPEEVARAAAVIRSSAREALEDLRTVIGVLRDGPDSGAPLPPQPTLAALPGLLEESRAAGMRLHADVRLSDPAAVPDATGRHALRIVQEALTNARKHATSSAVELRVDGAPGEGLTLEVRNRAPVLAGVGPEIPGSGTGLVGLTERATLSGGHLVHGLDEDGDFRLRAWLPWPG
jgi:signal transduction histidine kinase